MLSCYAFIHMYKIINQIYSTHQFYVQIDNNDLGFYTENFLGEK